MRTHLLGYLLGALDPAEREEVRQHLQADPALRRQLAKLEANLAFFDLRPDEDDVDPPEGLAERTCALVDRYEAAAAPVDFETDDTDDTVTTVRPASLCSAPAGELSGSRHRWSLADLLIAAGVCMATAFLFFPAIANSRHHARIGVCQNKLRQLGSALGRYSDYHEGYFPRVPADGNLGVAGVYSTILMQDGQLSEPQLVICPASNLADEAEGFRIPSVNEVREARGPTLIVWQRSMGGSFGYAFGYLDSGKQYRAIRNRGRTHFALMADAPDPRSFGRTSVNHGGRGQNVLFESGRVQYLVTVRTRVVGDDPFASDRDRVEAGRHQDDAVIGRSGTRVRLPYFPPPVVEVQEMDYELY